MDVCVGDILDLTSVAGHVHEAKWGKDSYNINNWKDKGKRNNKERIEKS